MTMRLLRGWVRLACALGCFTLLAGSAEAQRSFELAADPAAEIVYFSEAAGEIEYADGPPWLRVYADGLVRVHRPLGSKRAGDWELRLGAAELRALVRALVDRRVVEFDAEHERGRLKQRAVANRQAGGALSGSSDPDTITLELRLARYTGADARVRSGVDQRIRWTGVRADARRHPEIAEIRDLAAAAEILRALMARDDLVAVEEGSR